MGRSSRRRRQSAARSSGGGGGGAQAKGPANRTDDAAQNEPAASPVRVDGPVADVNPASAAAVASQIEAKPTTPEAGVREASSPGPIDDAVRGEPTVVPVRPALLGPEPWSAGGVAGVARSARLWLGQVHRWARRSRAAITWVVVVGLTVLLLLAVSAVSLSRSTPSWWGPMDFDTLAMRDLSRRVENGAISHITADHQGGGAAALDAVVWPVKLSDDGANAWLQLRLPVWLPKLTAGEFEEVVNDRGEVVERVPIDGLEWPEAVREVRVAFKNGRFRIGAMVGDGSNPRHFSATLAPEVREDGSLWMRATSVSIGRLSLPAWLVLAGDGGLLKGSMPADLRETAEAEALFQKLMGRTPVFEDAVIRLGDGRRVRLLELAVGEQSLVARFRTEWEALAVLPDGSPAAGGE